jgi:hypothetical protein
MRKYIFNNQELLVFENGDVYKKMSGFSDGNAGYRKYTFNGKRIFAHQLIEQVFLPNPNSKPCVNHKDGNVTNNNVNNLEWCTHKENIRHSYDVLKRKLSGVAIKPISGRNHYRSTPILQCDLEGTIIREWESISKAAQELNIDRVAISNVLKGRTITSGGYKWRYKNKINKPEKPRKQKRYKVFCETTNTEYRSIYEAAKKNNTSFSAIFKAIEYNRPFKGLKFKYLEK